MATGDSSPVSLGTLQNSSALGSYNELIFIIQQAISKLQTATLVQIQACTNDGGVSPFGFVDVTPLVAQVDGFGNAVPYVTVYGLPYLRLQGGANAVILDPQVGDIGVAIFASRDISKVKSTQAQAPPGSRRQYNLADGIYLGGLLNAAPTQYLQFSSAGVSIHTSQDIDVTASGNLTLSGASIQAGSSAVPVVSEPFITWVNGTLLPALAAHSITVAAPPADSLTSTFEAS